MNRSRCLAKSPSSVLLLTALVAALPNAPARAENKKAEEAIIINLSILEMTVSRGHDVHVTYRISKDAIISFNGLPAKASDLRAGMIVTVRPDSTGKIALAIRAHNALRRK